MALKNDLRNKLFSSYGGQVFFYKIRRVREKLCLARYSDYEYVQKIAKERFGREKDLADPKTFTENGHVEVALHVVRHAVDAPSVEVGKFC